MKKWIWAILTLWVITVSMQEGRSALFASEDRSYESLPITQDEKRKISKIVVTLAEDNVVTLLFEKKKLEQLGQEIHHVHPIRFLETIFTDVRLTSCVAKIWKNSFKWEGFMGGLSQRLHQEMKGDNVAPYLASFCAHLGVDQARVEQYVARQDFEGLVIFLQRHSRR